MKNKKIYLFGFSKWKRNFIKPFFPDSKQIFVEDYRKVPKNVSLYIWGMKDNIELLNFCKENFIKILKVEDCRKSRLLNSVENFKSRRWLYKIY